MKNFPEIKTKLVAKDKEKYLPYERDENLVRAWAIPGMKGFEHRLGGLEKMDITGAVSYVPSNHERMTYLRDQKVEGDEDADILVIGWGSTYGHLRTTLSELNKEGKKVAHAHFNYINPLPRNTEDVLKKYKKILVCELNSGQFVNYLRMKFPEFKYLQYNKMMGLPFAVNELKEKIIKVMEA